MSQDTMLKDMAQPCLACTDCTCAQAVPYIPNVTSAFARDDMEGAYASIRSHNMLPEMSARVCSSFSQAEVGCVEIQQGRNAVPVRDIVRAVSHWARKHKVTAVNIASRESGKKIAVIGGGPAGVSAAVRLLEFGYRVVLFEAEQRLGGAPETLFCSARYEEAQTEIMPILQRALNAHRLELRFNRRLGKHVRLKELVSLYDAILLSTGLWQEFPFEASSGEVVGAINFLREVKAGDRVAVHGKVAILAGGDEAFDVAEACIALGAESVSVVTPDAPENLEWPGGAAWFEKEQVTLLPYTQPIDFAGGLQTIRTQSVDGLLYQVENSEETLAIDFVVSATGVTIADGVRAQIEGLALSEYGLVVETDYLTSQPGVFVAGSLMNGGVSVSRCVQDGMEAAEAINAYLKQV